ncbi:MAG: indole-3-glycerol phosphate synthase TrpC [Gemmatimonadota bacterium]
MPETQEEPVPGRKPRGEEDDVLTRIVETKRGEVAKLTAREEDLRAPAAAAPPPRDFAGAIAGRGAVSLIAEVKRRSPGAGPIRPGLDPVEIARAYEGAGAAAISVLTDGEYFGGSLEDLTSVRNAVALPVLRKDFILAPVQVREARAAGADAILLIVRILDDRELRELRLLAEGLGMAVLVEAHDGEELERALASGASLVGINNRDLRNFTTRLETTLDLLERVPEGIVLVSESGIRTSDDVRRLGARGVHAVLVGESLLRAPDPGAAARELVGIPVAMRTVP